MLQFFRDYLFVFLSCHAVINICVGFIGTAFVCMNIILYGIELGSKLQILVGLVPLLNGFIVQIYDRLILGNFGYTTCLWIQIDILLIYILVIDKLGWEESKRI